MRRECSHCGSDEEMPFTCRYCGQPYCSQHRLPENHDCRGLEDYKEQLRERGQLIAETPEVKVEREMQDEPTGGGRQRVRMRRGGSLEGMFQRLQGRVTWVLLGLMVATTAIGLLLEVTVAPGIYPRHFTLHAESWQAPWTLLTSVFAHGGFGHLFVNGLVLFFFGPALERRVGTRAFLTFFLVTGVIAGVAQVLLGVGLVEAGIRPAVPHVLGASGAILGVLGALTILAPDAKILLMFVVPIPLWLFTLGFAFLNIVGFAFGLFGRSFGVAFLAHLTGLAIGLYVAHRHWRRAPRGAMQSYRA